MHWNSVQLQFTTLLRDDPKTGSHKPFALASWILGAQHSLSIRHGNPPLLRTFAARTSKSIGVEYLALTQFW
jgi:hypothetical protein